MNTDYHAQRIDYIEDQKRMKHVYTAHKKRKQHPTKKQIFFVLNNYHYLTERMKYYVEENVFSHRLPSFQELVTGEVDFMTREDFSWLVRYIIDTAWPKKKKYAYEDAMRRNRYAKGQTQT